MISDQFRARWLSAVCAFALSAAFVALPGVAGAQSGILAGRVTIAGTTQPVSDAHISVGGTRLGTSTGADGSYRIRGLTAGTYTVHAQRIGYAEQQQSVTIASGGAATANFSMSALATKLEGVVTTATGQQRQIEVGNSIAKVDAASVVETKAVSGVADLLTSRAAGVLVTPGLNTGGGSRIRIRGTSSLSLSNDPIYVIDGVRVEGTTGSSSVSVGGTTQSRIDDINPEEIESIEVVRGPSAATLYGTAAANGVIVITTKHGQVGKPSLTYFTEQGVHVDKNTYPTAYRGWTTGKTAATTSSVSNTAQCYLTASAYGTCMQDSVTSYNLYNDPQSTPNGAGYRQAHGLQLSGGSPAVRYFMSGEWESEDGVLKLPEFDQAYLTAHGRKLRPEDANPNRMGRISTRANFNMSPTPKFDLAFNTGYISQNVQLPTSDDSGVEGVAGNTYGGPGFKYNINPTTGDTLYGWRQITPRDIYQVFTNQAIQRLITSGNGNWHPNDWFTMRADLGVDYINRLDTQLCRFGECPNLGGDSRLGFKIDNRTNFFTYTANLSGSAVRRLTDAVTSTTTLGVQFNRSVFDRNGAQGVHLSPGATTITGAGTLTADESTNETRTLGGLVEQRLAFGDRLFLTGAVRSDRNSAFGANFKTVLYPKLSASWVVSDQSFFLHRNWLNQLRLRAAYGASGVQPGTTDAVQYYTATTALNEAGVQPALVFTALGNRDLKPERSSELELGVDATLFGGRITAEITHYDKESKDALVSRVLPPSLGTGSTVRFENLGQVSNKGWEALVTLTPIQRESYGWDITLNGSSNTNDLVSLGGVPPIVLSSTLQNRQGHPLYGWWTRPILSYSDKNHDGIIEYNKDPALSEVTIGDTAVYLGASMPKYQLAVTNGVEFFHRLFRVSAMLDYKGDYKVYNNTQRIRCASRNNCEGLISKNASLFDQARTVAVRETPARTVAGFIEPGDFIRFRELNVTYTAPDRVANKFLHSNKLAITLAARNLGILWTKYTGVDPEAFATTGNAPSEFQAFGPPTYYELRFSIGF